MCIKKKMRTLFVFLLVFLGVAKVSAQNNYTPNGVAYEIKDMVFSSATELINPDWSGFVTIRFTEPLSWLVPDSCDTTTVAIRPDDKHLISAVQAAYATGKGLRLYSETISPKLDGTICVLRALRY